MVEPLYNFQLRVSHNALDMMARGVHIDESYRAALDKQIAEAMEARLAIVSTALGRPVTATLPRSPKQMAELFSLLGARPGTNRKTGRPTYDDETLFALAKKKPALAPVCHAIMEFRSLGQMRSTFVKAKLEPDGKMRCTFNTAGPETFRLSSSSNAFGRGTNLQNVTTGDRSLTGAVLPNLRRAIIPPVNHLLFEPDLAGADAQVVAWESGDEVLKEMFRRGVKIHAENAKIIYGGNAGPDGKREPYYTATKRGVHAYNYYAKPRTVAASLGITVAEAERFRRIWFGAHPAIEKWHKRVRDQLYATKTITNIFGYRIVFFDRIDDGLVGDALAWIGQGTVAQVANRAWDNIERNVPEVRIILQEHDSVVGEAELDGWDAVRPRIRDQFMSIVLPYDDPLIIPPKLKVSEVSWGDMIEQEW